MRDELKDQIARSLVELGFAVVTLVILRKTMNPDFVLTLKMHTARLVKQSAQRQADAWQRLADGAATAYQKARM